MKKTIALLSLATLPIMGVVAQENSDNAEGGKFGPYETNRFKDNWFIGIDGGVQTIFGGDNAKGDFMKRLAPTFDINFGKWITPNVGVRLVGGWGKINGFGPAKDSYYLTGEPNADGIYKKKYNLWNVHADLMYNISNAWWGYKEDRVYNCIPYAGYGFLRSYKGDAHSSVFSAVFGIINQFRLSDAWKLNVELNTALCDGSVDRKLSCHNIDAFTGLKLGVSYTFKRRTFKRAQIPNYAPYNQRIASLEDELAQANARANNLQNALDAEKNKPAQVQETVAPCEAPKQSLFFPINKATLGQKEEMNLKLYADAINAAPKDQKYTITGYADLQTGSRAFNEKLAKERAQAVADVLVDKYGVDSDRLIVEAGNLENPPFDKKVYNRSVILSVNN